jgi:3'-5' exonuclease
LTRKERNQTLVRSFMTGSDEHPNPQSIAAPHQDPPASDQNEDSVLENDFWEVECQRLNAARKKLKEIMNHPSMKFGNYLDDDDDEDADSYLSDDDDDNDDSGSISVQKQQEKKQNYRRRYLPPKGSVVSEYLTGVKDKVMKGTLQGFNLDDGQKWIPPQADALSIGLGNRPVADRWYLGRIWVYVWMPLRQYGQHVDKLHPCAFCGECNTHSKGLYWRPMFFHHMIVFVLHQRFQCKNPHCCGSTKGKRQSFASIDPRALSKLPTRVAERFEFVTTPGGPGIHRSMMYMFVNLACKSILFGSFADMVNELFAIDYSMECASYYGELKEWDPRSVMGHDGSPIQPYSAFGQVGEHNGMRLTTGLLKSLFYIFMELEEPYMQASFQHNYDEGAAGDDTHKYSSKIFVNTTARSRAQPFSASYTLLNKSQTIACSRLKYTKSHDEMKPILQEWKAARQNAGAPKLKKFETDNVASDECMWLSLFPELRDGVVPYDPNPNVPSLMLSDEDYRFFTTTDAVDNFVLASLDILDSLEGQHCYYGLDLEWNRNSPRTSLLQVSFEGLPALVIHLHKMSVFPKELRAILQMEKFVACGRSIAGDINRLSELGVKVARSVELDLLAKTHNPDQHTGLAELAITYCNLKIDNKEWGQNADYEVDELPVPLIEYGATDSILSRMIAQKLLSLTMEGPAAIIEPPSTLQVGSLVEICHHRRAVAKGCILFLGNERGSGEVKKWGDVYVGAGKAIVQIDEVLVPGYKPPIHFKDKNNPEANWPDDATLGMLHDTEGAGFLVVCRLASLRVQSISVGDVSAGDIRVGVIGTGVVGAGVVGAGVVGEGVVGAGVIGTGVVGVGVIGAGDVCVGYVGVGDDSVEDFGAGDVSVADVGVGAIGAGVVGAGVVGAGVIGTGVVGTGVVSAGVIGTGVVGAGVIGTGVIGVGVVGAGVGAGVIGAGVVGTGDVGAGDVSTGDIGAGDIGMVGISANAKMNAEMDAGRRLNGGGVEVSNTRKGADNTIRRLIRSRCNGDIFHIFDNLPLGRNIPITPTLYQLLLMATFIKNKEEEEAIIEVRSKLGVDDFLLDEYFNREYYRSRIRMAICEGPIHAANICWVKETLRDDPICKEYWTKELDEYLENFASKAERGWYEDIPDVPIYQFKGVDSNGLKLWKRERGTNHCEVYHQKIDAMVGPMGIGARTAHYLMVLRSFRYNVSAYVTRLGKPNFGHPYLHIQDRIQNLIMEILGVKVWPFHTNGLEFKATNFVSIGIGPVCLDPELVDVGQPNESLSPDLYFMAERMGVCIPPLPLSTEKEYKLYTRAVLKYPSVNKSELREIGILFKKHSNGKDIFPKTISMLKAHHDKWVRNQLIRRASMGMSENVKRLKQVLSLARVDSPPDAHTWESKQEHIEAALTMFVPPLTAPMQECEILTITQKQRKCSWEPYCTHRAPECGGWTRVQCRFYGAKGTKEAPTLIELMAAREAAAKKKDKDTATQKRSRLTIDNTRDKDDTRDCSWYPYCKLPVSACGGYRRNMCCVYGGDKPIYLPPDMDSEFVKKARQERRAQQVAVCRKWKKARKKCSGSGSGRGSGSGSGSDTSELLPPYLLESVSIPGPDGGILGTVTLSFSDTATMLDYGEMLNDNIISGYLNLLAKKCKEFGCDVRVVSTQFYPAFQQHGWSRVRRWVRETGGMASNWESAPLIFLPVFTGPTHSGHWTACVVDRVRLFASGGVVIYQDSLSPTAAQASSKSLMTSLSGTPLLKNEATHWITVDAPTQAPGSNACGVHVCGFFAAYASALLNGCLYSEIDSSQATMVFCRMEIVGLSAKEWGQLGRRHILESLRSRSIDIQDPAIVSVKVRLYDGVGRGGIGGGGIGGGVIGGGGDGEGVIGGVGMGESTSPWRKM